MMTRGVALALLLACWTTSAYSQVAALSFADRPRLVRCDDQPCFRILLDATDQTGRPATLPDKPDAYRVVDLRSKIDLRVFHVAPLLAGKQEESVQRPICSLLLFDLSGSMNASAGGGETRYEAAVRVLTDFVARYFRPGVSRWAIVGFHSRHVADDVMRARFAETAADVLAQVRLLDRPGPTNNTALYSAVGAALQRLKQEKEAGSETRLFVFTDGKNEVFPERGDDEGLLGSEGLSRVEGEAELNRVETITIGFGRRGDAGFDERILQALAWPTPANYHYAADGESLANVFEQDQQKLASRMQLSIGPIAGNKDRLTEPRPLRVYVDGVAVNQDQLVYVPPPMTPVYEGTCGGEERVAFARWSGASTADRGQFRPRLLVLAADLLIFGVAWFLLPRLIWRGRYAPKNSVSFERAGPAATGSGAEKVAGHWWRRAVRRRLEIVEGLGIGRVFDLGMERVTLGTRESDADWVIPDNRRRISRCHCVIVRQGRHYFIADRSTNGTSINGRPIAANQPVRLRRGDRIDLAGATTLLFR